MRRLAILTASLASALGVLSLPPAAVATPAADFNADGYADLAIGAPREDLPGDPGWGAVTILPGGPGGPVISKSRQFSGATPGLKGANNRPLSQTLAAGDFDGDGRSDLAIGSDFAVNLLYGARHGLSVKGNRAISQRQKIAGVHLKHGYFGSPMASGDFNGDRYDDLAVGAPGFKHRGAVVVLFGGRHGLRAKRAKFIPGEDIVTHFGAFGDALASGDLNGDGRDELIVGAPGDASGRGTVFVYKGTRKGIGALLMRLGPRTRGLRGRAILNPDDAYQAFGVALAAGDINGDGREELLIASGQEFKDDPGHDGALHILYGSRSGPSLKDDQLLREASPGLASVGPSEGFGDVAVGNLNGDGYDDLIIEDVRIDDSTRSVHLIYGSNGGMSLAGNQVINEGTPGLEGDGIHEGDQFVSALTAADLDADGIDELAIGERQDLDADIGFDCESGSGGVHIIPGTSSGPSLAGDLFITQDTPGIAGDGGQPCDAFGASLAGG